MTNHSHCLNDLLPMKCTRRLRDKGHDYVLPHVRTERFKRCLINRRLCNFVRLLFPAKTEVSILTPKMVAFHRSVSF